MSTGSFDSSIEGRKEKSRTPCSSRGFCLFVLSVVVLFCYFISISGCSYRRRKNIFVGQSSCLQESKKETVLRLLFFSCWCSYLLVCRFRNYFHARKLLNFNCILLKHLFWSSEKKGDHASLNFSIIGIFM